MNLVSKGVDYISIKGHSLQLLAIPEEPRMVKMYLGNVEIKGILSHFI